MIGTTTSNAPRRHTWCMTRATIALVAALSMTVGSCLDDGGTSSNHDDQPQPPPAAGTGRPQLWLTATSPNGGGVSGETAVNLNYDRASAKTGPRVVQVFVVTEGLELESFDSGEATETAGKLLDVQQKGPGRLRVIIYTTSNTHQLDTGRLAVLHFRRTQSGPAHAELVAERSPFAPQEANDGLLLGERLEL